MLRRIALGFLLALLVAMPVSVQAEDVEFKTKFSWKGETFTESINGLLFRPDGDGPFPAVVLLPACGGYSKPHVAETWPKFLTGNGFATLTVSNYESRGFRRCNQWRPRGQRRMAIVHDSYGALDYLAKLPYIDGNRVAVTGFSEGANAINLFMYGRSVQKNGEPNFKAAISFYGRCNRLRRYSKDDIPLMQIVPEHDVSRTERCISMGKATDMNVQVLKGAYHGFDQPEIAFMKEDSNGNEMLYDENATKKSQELVKNFLAKHLGK